ncbi:MAG: NAD+ synthetase, partial [Bradymonadaceae bacterium]
LGELPLGDVVFDCDGLRIGFEICEDAWAGDRPGESMVRTGVDLILNPSASHFAFGKQRTRKRFVVDGSRAFGVGYVYANLLGNESGRLIYDGGTMIAADGELVANGPRFSFRDVLLTCAPIDVDTVRMRRGQLQRYEPHAGTSEATTVSVPFSPPQADGRAPDRSDPAWWDEPDEKEEQFARAEALALFDYLRKSGAQGFVVSLSGGADSSTTACLVALMVRLAVDDLGMDRFRDKLDHIESLADVDEPRRATEVLLTTVYQATRNSSETTRRAAETLASALGADHLELDVDGLITDRPDRALSV